MSDAPHLVRVVCGPALDGSAGPETGWWPRFRQFAESFTLPMGDLVERGRAEAAKSVPSHERPLFESLQDSFGAALFEPVAPRALSLTIEPARPARFAVVVALEAGPPPSQHAMALLQGALLGFGSRVGSGPAATQLSERGCAIELGAGATTFHERLAMRGLDGDVVALGLDPEKLALLADGSSVSGRGTAAPALRDLETEFHLTPTQARVALRLLAGASLREAATLLNMTYGTARVHLKQIFAKLDVQTQAALVAKLLSVKP